MRQGGLRLVGIFVLAGCGWAWSLMVQAADLSKGKSIYAEVCMTCHGLDGRGAESVKLNPPPADLTSAGVQGKLDAGLFKSIHDGRKNTAMGAWKYALSDEEIQDVIAYVRTLGGGAGSLPKP
jgi:mono/diheme cytochrome c family protein